MLLFGSTVHNSRVQVHVQLPYYPRTHAPCQALIVLVALIHHPGPAQVVQDLVGRCGQCCGQQRVLHYAHNRHTQVVPVCFKAGGALDLA